MDCDRGGFSRGLGGDLMRDDLDLEDVLKVINGVFPCLHAEDRRWCDDQPGFPAEDMIHPECVSAALKAVMG